MNRQLDAIYRDEKRVRDFKFGFRQGMKAAAEFVDSYEGSTFYRMGDLLLWKFNLTKRKPRKMRGKR